MTDPIPCTTTVTDAMRQLHEWLTVGVGITAMMTLGVMLDRLRMLWADYRRKHKINGGQEV